MSKVYELAKKYYPRLWGIDRIEALYKSNKLTEEQYQEITQENQEQSDEK